MKTPTDEEMNVAICEWLGWEVLKEGYGAFEWGWFNEASHNPPKCLPNHVTGIEALGHLHEAEKRLRTPMGDESDRMVEDRMHRYAELLNYAIDATSRQRAEALCRIIKPSLFE